MHPGFVLIGSYEPLRGGGFIRLKTSGYVEINPLNREIMRMMRRKKWKDNLWIMSRETRYI